MNIPIKYQTCVNFNDCPLSIKNGMYGGMAGNKDGIIYRNSNWMIKYPKNTRSMNNVEISYTTAPLCEFIGSHIYSIMGYDTHETLLGERNNKIVVACKDFESNDTRLVEMRTIKNYASQKLSEILERDFSSTGERHFVLLDEMLLYLKESDILNSINGLEDRFWDMTVVDLIIGNSDRNNGNWGILRNPYEKDRLAPIFDNGAFLLSNK